MNINSDYHFIFCHGFGFNKRYWEPLAKHFVTCKTTYWDLGYFNNKDINLPEISNKANETDITKNLNLSFNNNTKNNTNYNNIIIIGHSLGMIKLLQKIPSPKAIIGLQSFVNFLGTNKQNKLHKIRLQNLYGMIKAFENNPTDILTSFYNHCGIKNPNFININNFNFDLLLNDLNMLKDSFELPRSQSTLIIGSKNDSIVPTEIINDNFLAHKNVKIVLHNTNQHSLGHLEPKFVFENISNFVNSL